ncbi:Uncharacterised protein [Mycobacteroides abscessus subsp. abscessus]|nr:Uncharacterised protein [Mycobacteroides abscessus subsp. abscessus]
MGAIGQVYFLCPFLAEGFKLLHDCFEIHLPHFLP